MLNSIKVINSKLSNRLTIGGLIKIPNVNPIAVNVSGLGLKSIQLDYLNSYSQFYKNDRNNSLPDVVVNMALRQIVTPNQVMISGESIKLAIFEDVNSQLNKMGIKNSLDRFQLSNIFVKQEFDFSINRVQWIKFVIFKLFR